MLEKELARTDPETTDVVVLTAKVAPHGSGVSERTDLGVYDRQLLTAMIQVAEKAGKQITPVVIRTNNPLYAVL